MNRHLISLFFMLSLFFCMSPTSTAQDKDYTDHKPVYRKWQDSYILDKIEYTKSSTVFYFRFVCRSGQGISAIFYPPKGDYPWYLRGKSGRNYNLKAIKNIRRNSEMLAQNLNSKKEYPSLDGFGYTVFSCEVHFDRLPNDEQVADLIEGYGQEGNQNHFNCFDVTLKTWNNKELGQIKDSEDNVRKFENKFGVTNTNVKPEPKVEPKLVPKKEDPIAKVDPPKKEEPKKEEPKKEEPKKTPPTPKPDLENPYPIPRLRDKNDIACGKKMVLDAIQFQDNTTDFKGMVQCQQAMQMVHEYLRDNPKATATIIGHSDIFGSSDRNTELSKQRAMKVQRYISMLGTSAFRINIEYHGPSEPIKKEGSPLNRRVELLIKCK